MTDESQTYLDVVGQIIEKLEAHDQTPVLVGGMALVILGSQRVTKDFDLLISEEARNLRVMVQIFYHFGLELVSKVNKQGEVIRTIDNQKIAYSRLQVDKPESAYFYNHKTGLRVDLLFDFPVTAIEVAKKAQKKKIRSHMFTIASKSDLIRLKEIAYQNRKLASDAQDLEFLKQKL
ncbi:MAG: hypothetical protein BMS9Abin31_0952 [Gammaproteobacteria bacterium]|nr:MAG: hypothetical protein BMS9Abin31_0952 [Gammaproteobacteria bacterium]